MPIQKRIISNILKEEVLETSSNAKILDVGCGLGEWLEMVSQFRRTLGLEINIDVAKLANSVEASFFSGVIVYDGTNFPFKSEVFELIYMPEVIEHVKNDKQFLSECYRVAKCNSILILTTPNGAKELINPIIHKGHVRHYTKDEIISRINESGFIVEEVFWRLHPFCSFFDYYISLVGSSFLKKDIDLGHNVVLYNKSDQNLKIAIRLYQVLLEPLLYILVIIEFMLLRYRYEGRNIVIIARKDG